MERREEARAEVAGVMLTDAEARGIAVERVAAPDLTRIVPGKRNEAQGAAG